MTENKKNFLRNKRIKALIKKVQKSKEELIKDKMLLLFKLERELDKEYIYKKNK